MGWYDGVGINMVEMYIGSLIVVGVEPRLYSYGTGRSEVEEAKGVVEGIAEGCQRTNWDLIEGETAEMPSMY